MSTADRLLDRFALLLAWRYVVLVLAMGLLTCLAVVSWDGGVDWGLLSRGGHLLLSRQAVHTYVRDPGLQAGPLSLVVIRCLDAVSGDHGVVLVHALLAAELPAVLFLVERTAATLSPPVGVAAVRRRQAAVLAAGLFVVPLWCSLSGDTPHIDDGLAIAFAVLALRFVAADRRWLAALSAGAAADAKPWAICAVAVLAGLSDQRTRAIAVALAVPAVSWLPLLVGDPGTLQAAGGLSLTISRGTPVGALHLLPTVAPHWFRAAELSVIAVMSVVAAHRRGWVYAFAAGMVTRLLVECAILPYYDADTLLALAACEIMTRRPPWRTGVLWLGLYLDQAMVTGEVQGLVRLVVLAAVLSTLVRRPAEQPSVQPTVASDEQQSRHPVALLAS